VNKNGGEFLRFLRQDVTVVEQYAEINAEELNFK
jgi:hypothetical protein